MRPSQVRWVTQLGCQDKVATSDVDGFETDSGDRGSSKGWNASHKDAITSWKAWDRYYYDLFDKEEKVKCEDKCDLTFYI
jgi:hypothetical protein